MGHVLCWTSCWQRSSELTGGTVTTTSLLVSAGSLWMVLTDLLDFNIGVLCLRTTLNCFLKAVASVARGIK
jgi:hypothetical protein